MAIRPVKPKNYRRDYAIIVALSCLSVPVITNLELDYLNPTLPFIIFAIASEYWFKEYNQEVARYEKALAEERLEGSAEKSRVNESIERYQRELRERKNQAKWWQFWY